MQIKKTLITPSIAKQMIEANVKNRRINLPTLLRYYLDMIEGKWVEDTGEMIKISKTGVILDGQHRLHALIKANVSLYFHIITGLEDSVFSVLDTGKSRNATDLFKIAGIKHDCLIPAVIQKYNILKAGFSSTQVQKNSKLTNKDLLKQYHEREQYWQITAQKVLSWYENFSKIIPTSLIGGFYALFSEIAHDNANDFMNQLCTGKDVKNNVIVLLRKKLTDNKLSSKKLTLAIMNAYIIKGWNFYRMGQNVNRLQFDPDKEQFPKPI